MFNDFASFKKATQLLFNETCSSGLKLSQYRDRVAQMAGFANTQALKDHFDNADQKTQVVSVILYMNEAVHSKYDFKDNEVGNKQAEELFKKIIQEYMPSYDDVDLDYCLDNGYFEDDNSDYQIFITHSS